MQCAPQERNIEQAKSLLQDTGRQFDTVKLNALEERQLVKLMNVMTVPTTVLLNSQGSVIAWNAGLVNAQKLVDQMSAWNFQYSTETNEKRKCASLLS
jgi:hypothetical protein